MHRRIAVASVSLLAAVVALAGGSGASGASLPEHAHDEAHAHATHGPDGLALDKRGKSSGATYSVDDHEPWNTCEYDGRTYTTDQADLPELAGLPQVHAVYVHPAKTNSRFTTFGAMFQADARQASRLLQTLGRDVRWDRRAGTTSCGGTTTAAAVLDVTVFKSAYNAKQLSTGRQFSLVANELASSGKFSAPNKKYVVWLDAGSRYCGQGTLWQDTTRAATNSSEVNRTTGIVYRPYSTSDRLTGGFCRGRTLLHELGHNLGSLQSVAPNAFDGAHCDDDNNDTMCYPGQASDQVSSPEAQFDYGKDDYWDLGAAKPTATDDGYPRAAGERLPWWTLNLSKYVCPPAADGSADCAVANADPGY